MYGVKRRIAIVEPYYPVIQPRIASFFAEHGIEVVRFNTMQGAQISAPLGRYTSAIDVLEALGSNRPTSV